jgi:hypothetical protein
MLLGHYELNNRLASFSEKKKKKKRGMLTPNKIILGSALASAAIVGGATALASGYRKEFNKNLQRGYDDITSSQQNLKKGFMELGEKLEKYGITPPSGAKTQVDDTGTNIIKNITKDAEVYPTPKQLPPSSSQPFPK